MKAGISGRHGSPRAGRWRMRDGQPSPDRTRFPRTPSARVSNQIGPSEHQGRASRRAHAYVGQETTLGLWGTVRGAQVETRLTPRRHESGGAGRLHRAQEVWGEEVRQTGSERT